MGQNAGRPLESGVLNGISGIRRLRSSTRSRVEDAEQPLALQEREERRQWLRGSPDIDEGCGAVTDFRDVRVGDLLDMQHRHGCLLRPNDVVIDDQAAALIEPAVRVAHPQAEKTVAAAQMVIEERELRADREVCNQSETLASSTAIGSCRSRGSRA